MLRNAIVVVADGSQARLFALQPEAAGSHGAREGGFVLEAVATIDNADHRTRADALYADKPGRAGRHAGHVYDDHRQAHDEQGLRRFAREVAARAGEEAAARRVGAAVVVAPPQTLGHLRPAFAALGKADLVRHELAKDLLALGPVALHEHLADQGWLCPPQGQRTGL